MKSWLLIGTSCQCGSSYCLANPHYGRCRSVPTGGSLCVGLCKTPPACTTRFTRHHNTMGYLLKKCLASSSTSVSPAHPSALLTSCPHNPGPVQSVRHESGGNNPHEGGSACLGYAWECVDTRFVAVKVSGSTIDGHRKENS
jgi:hypothetical protein